jgi:EAL domain-containing protein (putative c-di-GMP-specific phosphodiesterase class I)
LISPDEFIPVAEETGLIVGIGAWVLKQATRQVVEWQRRFPSTQPLGLAVNVSPVQFRRGDVVRDVAAALSLSGLAPEHLTLEITESTLIDDVAGVADTLQQLKELGVRLALDDFGTGYSSLAHLQRFPFDVLKIDRAFIRDADDGSRADLARAIIDLGRNLDLMTVAEGIERPDQLEKFRELQAVYGQGYLFSRPGRGVEIEALLAARSRSLGYLS